MDSRGVRAAMLRRILLPHKPRVFVSYQHSSDQYWCNIFRDRFGQAYELFTDTSLVRKVNSENATYIDRAIREKNITGSSITVVLCGPNTWKRKFVDWEIHATLDKQHALLGIVLPTSQPNADGRYLVPIRLHDNIVSGYAHWMHWSEDPRDLARAIAVAKDKARVTANIRNRREKMKRNIT